MNNPTQPPIVLLSDDLMWMSRFLATTQALGLRLLAARDPARLIEHLKKETPCCVILELGSFPPAETAAAVRGLHPNVRLVAYGSHVDATTLEAARQAGCDPVLSKGRMADSMAELLPTWAADVR